ncbi:hypothetical protein R4529_09125 [Acinetobacter baumannii]|nr:hypothetical protein [Acinetobacter baumannii]MDV7496322.1 hypothetical protein [Acinetobacter baumannii]MDV7500200.1 hypothetical protein [Acinetobacter baumannii]
MHDPKHSSRKLSTYLPKNLRDQVIVESKKTYAEFLMIEVSTFASQIFIFFTCALYSSNFLRNEPLLFKYIDVKLKNIDVNETIILVMASLTAIGLLKLIQKAAPNESFTSKIIDSVINQIPKFFYTLSASFIGVLIAIIFFVINNPKTPDNLGVPAYSFFAVVTFIYGIMCGTGLAFLLNYKNLVEKHSMKGNAKDKPESHDKK